jgi:hypothetical protein
VLRHETTLVLWASKANRVCQAPELVADRFCQVRTRKARAQVVWLRVLRVKVRPRGIPRLVTPPRQSLRRRCRRNRCRTEALRSSGSPLRGFFIMNCPTSVLIHLEFSPSPLLRFHPLHRQRSRTGIGASNSTLFCVWRNRWPAAPKNTEPTQRHACVGLALRVIQSLLRSSGSLPNPGCA